MALFQSKQVAAKNPVPTSLDGVAAVAITAEFVVPAGLAANDIIEMFALPAGHVPIDLIVNLPDMDTNGTPTITLDAGLITGRAGDPVLGSRTCGNEFFAASTTGQAGGLARAAKSLAGIAADSATRGWGLKVATGAATLATGGTIRATLLCVPAPGPVSYA
jgi:hypothetical protein